MFNSRKNRFQAMFVPTKQYTQSNTKRQQKRTRNNNNVEKILNSILNSHRTSVLFGAVLSWCLLTTIYFMTVIDKRALIASSSIRKATPSFRNGPSRSFYSKETLQEPDPQEFSRDRGPQMPWITTGVLNLKDSQTEFLGEVKAFEAWEEIRSNEDETSEDQSSIEIESENDDEDESLNEERSNKQSNEDTLTMNNNFSNKDNDVVSVSATGETNAEPPACDMLHLAGGRYFWRNRPRLVDKDKSDICGPKILIIGTAKCGTNTLADLLERHPRIQLNSCNLKNTQGGCHQTWFQAALKQGIIFEGNDFTYGRRDVPNGWLDEFGKRLPMTDGINTMTFDKSPSYMDISIFPDVVEYVKPNLPNAKIVATLCNPAERLFSEFNDLEYQTNGWYQKFYYDNKVDPPKDFSTFVDLLKADNPICNDKRGFCDSNQAQYLKKGEYIKNLQPWYDAYGEDNVLVLNMDEDHSTIVRSLLQHLGTDLLPESEYPWNEISGQRIVKGSNPDYEGRSSAHQSFNEEMKWIEQYYAPYNIELAEFLRSDWPREWNCRLDGNC